MSIKIADYTFEGPFARTSNVQDRSGIYAILGKNVSNDWFVVDIGESARVKTRVDNHDRQMCWKNQQHPELNIAVFYANENSRMAIEAQLREKYNPPCGKR